ncbi:hypothetical protein TrCOL_g4674 [Triparma columacea]|uniref:Uncharacterized protein n=1 Tax=Triparma columacea TaxID=722753 RepID=A0A9W7GL09_9STRA|nr:hypothetical protein TrCOL_g4674 [Triparma columacea]
MSDDLKSPQSPPPPPPPSESSKKSSRKKSRRSNHVVQDHLTFTLSSVLTVRSLLPPSPLIISPGTKVAESVEACLGYLPGNAVRACGYDGDGDPTAIELYPLAVRRVLVKPKKGDNSGAREQGVLNGATEGNKKARKRRRVGSQRGGGNWCVTCSGDQWVTTEEVTGEVVVPMPTVHWLVSRHWNRVVSKLEDKYGGVEKMTRWASRPSNAPSVVRSHTNARERTLELLRMGGDYEEAVVKRGWFGEGRGVGGMSVGNGGMRCLHMHLAEWFATGEHEVGRMVEEWGRWEEEGRGWDWVVKEGLEGGEGEGGGRMEKG